MKIPNYIHLMHADKSKLNKVEKFCVDQWYNLHPDHDVIFHTDTDIRELVKKTYPHILGVYDDATGVIRGQIGRYLVMITHGGTYADVDVCPFTCVNNWIEPHDELITVRRGVNDYEMDYQFHSVKNHPVWEQMLLNGVEKWKNHTKLFEHVDQYRLCVFNTLSVHHLQEHVLKHKRRVMEPPTCSSYQHNWGADECYTTHFSSESWLPHEKKRWHGDDASFSNDVDVFINMIREKILK